MCFCSGVDVDPDSDSDVDYDVADLRFLCGYEMTFACTVW